MISTIKVLKATLILCLTIMYFYEAAAQKLNNQQIRLKKEVVNDISVTKPKSTYKKNVLADIIKPNFSLGGIEFPDPERNFLPSRSPNAAGDINGDGIADLFNVFFNVGDETTDQLEDRISKMEIFFGTSSGIDNSNSKLIREDFIYITDFNGDGTSEGIRVDTENGKVFVVVDESDGELTQFVEREILQLDFNPFIESYGDFNGDGFNDAILYSLNPDRSTDANLFLLYGADNIENMSADTLTYSPEGIFGIDLFLYTDTNGNDTTEVVQVSSVGSVGAITDPGLITLYHFDNSSGLQQIDQQTLSTNVVSNSFSLTPGLGKIASADLNQNGKQELMVESDSKLHIFTLSETEGEFYSESNIISQVFPATDFEVIGDFQGDGFPDFITLTENDAEMNFIAGNSNLDLVSEAVPLENNITPFLMFSAGKNTNNNWDINGDGFDDIVLGINHTDSSENEFRAYHGNSDGNFDITSKILFPAFETTSILHNTFNAGDVNGDSNPDFGILYREIVEIYFGGSSLSEPDLIIEAQDTTSFLVGSPAIGDFNNDGFSDVVLSVADFSTSQSRQGLYFYFGGSSADNVSDHQLLISELFPELEAQVFYERGFPAVANVGDINGDGTEDVIFSQAVDPNESHILLGSNTLSDTPDITLARHGTNFVKIGDMNGDSFNNFAVWSSIQDRETVFIYSGFDETKGESLSDEPLIIIQNPATDDELIEFFGFTMEAGDFDGDGFNDLVISPLNHSDGNGNGLDAFYFYRGGTEVDSLADHSFPLKNSFVANILSELGDVNTTTSDGELTVVPDMNSDGIDELLFGTRSGNSDEDGQTNAVIYFGNSSLTQVGVEPDVVLEAPNMLFGMGSTNNQNDNAKGSQTAHSAVGDFNGDGQTDILLPQPSDFNFIRSKSYFFELPVSVSNEEEQQIVTAFSLDQNYPNPFNPSTEIRYSLPQTGMVTLQVYDITGRLISTLVNENQVAGNHQVRFDAQNLSSGMYVYRLQSGSFTQTRKMILIK